MPSLNAMYSIIVMLQLKNSKWSDNFCIKYSLMTAMTGSPWVLLGAAFGTVKPPEDDQVPGHRDATSILLTQTVPIAFRNACSFSFVIDKCNFVQIGHSLPVMT